MPISIGIGLKEDSARRIFGGISGNGKGSGEVRKVKDWFREK